MADKGKGDDVWERLGDLAWAFMVAVYAERCPEPAKMGALLHALHRYPEFRNIAYAAACKHIAEQTGRPKPTLALEERQLLQGVEKAIRSSESDAPEVARCIVGWLPGFPQLYSRAPGAPDASTAEPDWDAHDAAVASVVNEIKRPLDDPYVVDARAVVRAAMRALGADKDYANRMFQSDN